MESVLVDSKQIINILVQLGNSLSMFKLILNKDWSPSFDLLNVISLVYESQQRLIQTWSDVVTETLATWLRS